MYTRYTNEEVVQFFEEKKLKRYLGPHLKESVSGINNIFMFFLNTLKECNLFYTECQAAHEEGNLSLNTFFKSQKMNAMLNFVFLKDEEAEKMEDLVVQNFFDSHNIGDSLIPLSVENLPKEIEHLISNIVFKHLDYDMVYLRKTIEGNITRIFHSFVIHLDTTFSQGVNIVFGFEYTT